MERARPGFTAVGVIAAALAAGAATPQAPIERPLTRSNVLRKEPRSFSGSPGRGHLEEHDPRRVERAQAKRERKAKRRLQEALARERAR